MIGTYNPDNVAGVWGQQPPTKCNYESDEY